MGFDDSDNEGVFGVRVFLDGFVFAAVDTVSGFEKFLGKFGD